MSRARQRKQEDKTAFLTENPELIEYDTNLSVVADGPGFTVEARDGLGQPLFTSLGGTQPFVNSTLAKEVNLLDGTLSVAAPVPSNPNLDPFIALSDNGIGVFSENDGGPLTETTRLNDGEALEFDFFGPVLVAPAAINGGYMTYGITDLLIEYEVLNNGAGTVTLEFDNAPPPLVHIGGGAPGPTPPEVVQIASGSKNDTGYIEVDAPMGMAFDGWELTVDGNVHVAVTGISYGTNFDGFATI